MKSHVFQDSRSNIMSKMCQKEFVTHTPRDCTWTNACKLLYRGGLWRLRMLVRALGRSAR